MLQKPIAFFLFIAFSAGIISLTSCDGSRLFEENHEIPEAVWTLDNLQQFRFEVADTGSRYSFSVNVRNTNDYTYANLYLFVELSGPGNKSFRDTLEVQMADNTGRWLGSGIGNVWQNQVPLVQGVKLQEKGAYQVTIGHGMREDALEGITDIGFRVEKR